MARAKKKTSIKQPVTTSRVTRKATAGVKASSSGSNTGPPVAPRAPRRGRGAMSSTQGSTPLSAPIPTQRTAPVRNSSTSSRSSSPPTSSAPLTQDDIPRIVEAVLSNMPQTTSHAVPPVIDDNTNVTETLMEESPPALNQIPLPSALSHISTVPTTNEGSTQPLWNPTTPDNCSTHYFVGDALPAVPPKLVERIESGAFIEMSDLSPEHLGQAALEEDPKSKSKHCPVSSITQWLQCFVVYTAVIARKQPSRVVDLMGYQILILEAYHTYRNDSWLHYDRRFRLWAAAQPGRNWASIDPTSWNLAFSSETKVDRCKHCFSFTHSTLNCQANGGTPEKKNIAPFDRPLYPSKYFKGRPICYKWNESKRPNCPHLNCRFEHVCYICAFDPHAKSVGHKAVFCPNNQ